MDMKLLVLVSVILNLNGCGANESASSVKDAPAAATSGTYSFLTSIMAMECSDGSQGSIDPISHNLSVQITGNEIKFNGTSSNDSQAKATAAGMAITVSGYTGLVQSSGSFNANQSGSATHVDYGRMILSYNLNGTIDSKSWNGNYKYSLTAVEDSLLCEYVGTFSGSKQ